ncbi:hypothetical protein U1Q18_040782 [Sarracenia purpurea var. burkii]
MAMVGRIWVAHPGGFIFGSGLMGSMITFHRPSEGWNFEDGWRKLALIGIVPEQGILQFLKSKGVWVFLEYPWFWYDLYCSDLSDESEIRSNCYVFYDYCGGFDYAVRFVF